MRKKTAALLGLATVVVVALAATPSALGWTVTMTAQANLKRTHHWTIQKSVNMPTITLDAGKTATVTYSVTVTPTGHTDSDWGVTGNVHMSSDADIEVAWMNVTILPDDILTTLGCTPSPFPVTLITPLDCSFSAALPDASSPRDAYMRAQRTDPPGNFRGVHTPFDFATATINEVDECIAVTDTLAGSLGTTCASNGPRTYTYTRTIGPYSTCGPQTIPNTASFVTNDTAATGSASASVGVTVVNCVPPGLCHETVNPAGNPAVGDNGYPNDPFGGDAVPGGKSTSPGTRGNGPINSDGFYLVGGLLFSDTKPIAYPLGGNVWPTNTTIKYTERGNNTAIKITTMAGPHSVIQWQVQAPGDLYVNAPMGAPGAIFCGVPPPPF